LLENLGDGVLDRLRIGAGIVALTEIVGGAMSGNCSTPMVATEIARRS
jgi:hypothetical protein